MQPMMPRDRMVYGSNAGASSPMARVVIDARERDLIELFKANADGFEVGVWIAPLLVEADHALVAEHVAQLSIGLATHVPAVALMHALSPPHVAHTGAAAVPDAAHMGTRHTSWSWMQVPVWAVTL